MKLLFVLWRPCMSRRLVRPKRATGHTPLLSPSVTNVQDLMFEYVGAVKIVAAREAALREKTVKDTMVISTHLEQDNV